MLQRSFSILPGIGLTTERSLWERDIHDWTTFLAQKNIFRIGDRRKRYFDARLKQASTNVDDPHYLSTLFPNNLHWRLFDHLKKNVAYLDIETTGLSYRSSITLVGVYRAQEQKMISLVKGMGLTKSAIVEALEDVSLVVTYNGASFDLPFIERQFPGALPKIPHFDLRFGAGRLGYRGGLKRLERIMGIKRDYEVENLAGEDALLYWRMWSKDRNRNALKLLRKYNAEDVKNLAPIAERVYRELKELALDGLTDPLERSNSGSI